MEPLRVLFFGDGVPHKLHASVRKLYHAAHTSAALTRYLKVFAAALQTASRELPARDRALIQADGLSDLSERYCHGPEHTGVTFLLISGVHLGWLVLQLDSEPNLLRDGDRIVVGLCAGLFQGLASAVSTDVDSLLRVVPEILRLSLWIGLLSVNRSHDVEQTMESWAAVLTGVPEEEVKEILSQFHESSGLPKHKKACISASFPSAVTVTAPPSTLDRVLASSETLSKAARFRIPGSLAIHTPYVESPDLDQLIDASPWKDCVISSSVQLISPSTGAAIKASTFKDAFIEIAAEILARPIQWAAIERALTSIELGGMEIFYFGLSNVSKLLQAFSSSSIRNIAQSSELAISTVESDDDIVIVGMAGRFPGADTLDDFWQIFLNERELMTRIPANRFEVDTHYDHTGNTPNTSLTPYGNFLDGPGLFDRKLFRMSPNEAKQTDPMHRLQLLTSYEALEMAGYAYDRTASTLHTNIGTFFAQCCDDWRQTNSAQEVESFFVPGGARAFAPGRVNYHFGWEGPSYSIDTACSASFAAIHVACQALHSNECSMAVASAANILTTPENFAGLTRGGFVSTTGASKTLDQAADGFCRADAVGTVVLKRRSDAMADNDNILAVIRGSGLNTSARAISMTHPHAETQADLFKRTLRQANLVPDDIDFFELHGTGTQAGDIAETTAITEVFACNTRRSRPLYVSSVKPNVGHSESASGLTSLIKTLLMLRHSKIPPHIGIKTTINPNLPPLTERNILVPKQTLDFSANGGKRRIMVNNLSASGGNACLIIEDYTPSRLNSHCDPRPAHVVTISAETLVSFQGNFSNFLEFVEREDPTLANLAYTTTARRIHHRFRKAYVASDCKTLAEQMCQDAARTPEDSKSKRAGVTFVFSGQGAQTRGIARDMYQQSAVFREKLVVCGKICDALGYSNLQHYLLGTDEADEDITGSQLGIVAFEVAVASVWQSLGIQPTAVMGHSLGEYAALYISGALSLADTLYLVHCRCKLLQDFCRERSHRMLAVAADHAQVTRDIESHGLQCVISCINGPRSTVVGGPNDEINRFADELASQNIKNTVLDVPYAFHTDQLEPILSGYATIANHIPLKASRILFGSTLLGSFVRPGDMLPSDYLVRQTREPVLFKDTLVHGLHSGALEADMNWIEIGPSPVCLAFIKATLDVRANRLLPSYSPEPTTHQFCKSLAQAYQNGCEVNWSAYHQEYEHHLSLLQLPPYSFDLENYWMQYRGDWALLKWRRGDLVQAPSHDVEPLAMEQTTARSRSSSVACSGSGRDLSSSAHTSLSKSPPSTADSADGRSDVDALRQIIASQLEVEAEELSNTADLGDLGMNSILALDIIGTFESKTGIVLPSTFFYEYMTLKDAQAYFEKTRAKAPNRPSHTEQLPPRSNAPMCKSYTLQQAVNADAPTVVLLPDGFGSAASYIGLYPVSADLRIIAFDSPVLDQSVQITTFEELAERYASSLEASLPRGPLVLAGWSYGGILAFAVAQILATRQHQISQIFLIDPHCPLEQRPVPVETIELLGRFGAFDANSTFSSAAQAHFARITELVGQWKPVYWDETLYGPPPRAAVLWARAGVLEELSDTQQQQALEALATHPETHHKWLLEARTPRFGGWDQLLPGIEMELVEGSHFTLMNPRHIEAIRAALQRVTKTIAL